jgi:uncharacterized membrane protein
VPTLSGENRPLPPLFWGLLLAAPALLVALGAAAGHGGIDRVIHLAFRPFCHQIPERSFVAGGVTLAVCARCTGFYLGLAAIGAAASLTARLGTRWHIRRSVVLLLLVPLAVDGSGNLLGLWATPDLVRAMTGLVAAAPLTILILGARNAAH